MSDLDTKMGLLEQEMLEQGRARNFVSAKRKEEDLYRLRAEKLRSTLPSENPEENLQFIDEKIQGCIDQRKWAEAQSLQQVLNDITRQVAVEESLEKKTTEVDEGSPMYGHLTVLQAHPLVWYDGKDFHKFSLPPNYEEEKKAIVGALNHAKKNGGRIDVSFEGATTFRISAVLADPGNRILHYSGHGAKDFVTMENWGCMQALYVNELKEFVSTGNLRFAFVSACHSRPTGEAFVKAGVAHVVCCHQDEKLDDVAAVEFTRNFYLHVACGQTLKQAFKVAKEATKIAPIDQNARFLLLPNDKDDDYHNVLLFRKTPLKNHVTPASGKIIGLPPAPPNPFLGRELEIYDVLKHLKHSRFIQITGEPGIGKSSLGHALCAYICERTDSLSFEDVYWISSSVRDLDGDEQGENFGEVMVAIADEHIPEDNTSITDRSKRIAECLHDSRSLVFIDGRHLSKNLSKELAMKKLRRFLEVVLRSTVRLCIILICPSGEEIQSKVIPYDAIVKLGPLDMRSSVLLFGNSCPYVAEGVSPAARTPFDLADLLVPKSQADATYISPAMSKRCQDIFGQVGEGNPDFICKSAREMSKGKYLELVDLGERQELQRENYDTRFALDQEWSRIARMFKEAKKGYDFLQAKQLHSDLKELGQLRDVLPTLDELRMTEKELCARRNDAVSIEDFTRAGVLQAKLSECREKIKREEEAALASAVGDGGSCPISLQDQNSLLKDDNDTTDARAAESLPEFLPDLYMYSVPLPEMMQVDGKESYTLVIATLPVINFKHVNSKSVIVCATNESCYPVPKTVSGAVIDAGGEAFKREVENLESDEKSHWGPVRCPTGKATIVGPAPNDFGYGDLHVPWVIFAVGPTYSRGDGKDSLKQKDALLRSAYRSCFELAKKENLEAIGFSLISCGQRAGGDLRRPLRIAVEVVAKSGYAGLKKVQLCAFRQREQIVLIEAAREQGLVQVATDPNAQPTS